jgi:CRISPR-associated protein Csx10
MLKIKYQINFLSEYHIGDGFSFAGIVDNTIIRDGKGRLIIPGHTIKGIARDALENLLSCYNVPCCNGTLENGGSLCGVNLDEKCFICQIFGSPFSKGNFYFTPAVYEERYRDGIVRKDNVKDLLLPSQFRISAHNKIDRETGRAAEKHLFTYQLGSSAEAFYGEIMDIAHSNNEVERDKCQILLITALRLVRGIGGRRRKGWGRCTIEIIEPENWKEIIDEKLKEVLKLNVTD